MTTPTPEDAPTAPRDDEPPYFYDEADFEAVEPTEDGSDD